MHWCIVQGAWHLLQMGWHDEHGKHHGEHYVEDREQAEHDESGERQCALLLRVHSAEKCMQSTMSQVSILRSPLVKEGGDTEVNQS